MYVVHLLHATRLDVFKSNRQVYGMKIRLVSKMDWYNSNCVFCMGISAGMASLGTRQKWKLRDEKFKLQ